MHGRFVVGKQVLGFTQHRQGGRPRPGLFAQVGNPFAQRQFPPAAPPGIQQQIERIRRLRSVDAPRRQAQFHGTNRRPRMDKLVAAGGQPGVDRQCAVSVAVCLAQHPIGQRQVRIAGRLPRHLLRRRRRLAALDHRLESQRQETPAQRRRVDVYQWHGGREAGRGARRAVCEIGGADRTPKRDLIAAGQPRILDAIGLGDPAREQRRDRAQSRRIRALAEGRIIGRCQLHHRLRLGAEAKRDHCRRRSQAKRPTRQRCREPGRGDLMAQPLQQHLSRPGAQIEAPRHAGCIGLCLHCRRAGRHRQPLLAASQQEPAGDRPHRELVRKRRNRHPLPGRQQVEFRCLAQCRNTLSGGLLGADQQGSAGLRVGDRHDIARRVGGQVELSALGMQRDWLERRRSIDHAHPPGIRCLAEHQGAIGGQRQTQHGRGRQQQNRGRAEQRIAAQSREVDGTTLIEHDQRAAAAPKRRHANRGGKWQGEQRARLPGRVRLGGDQSDRTHGHAGNRGGRRNGAAGGGWSRCRGQDRSRCGRRDRQSGVRDHRVRRALHRAGIGCRRCRRRPCQGSPGWRPRRRQAGRRNRWRRCGRRRCR